MLRKFTTSPVWWHIVHGLVALSASSPASIEVVVQFHSGREKPSLRAR